MEPLSVTASIIAVLQLSAKVLLYISDVRNAPTERSHCEAEVSNLSALLRALRDHVQTADSSQPWYTNVEKLAAPNGPFDQFKQALEALQNIITDGGRLKKVGEALVWKFKKEEITGILQQIERLKSLVEIALQNDHLKLSQAIKDDTSVVRTGVDKIKQDQANAKHGRVVEWVSPTNYPAQQSDIIGRRQKGTGQWFLDAPDFASWLDEPKSTLFCPGIPGAGKTMVAAIAIDHLLQSIQSSSIGVAYMYYNYKAHEEQDVSRMLAAIVKQLLQGRPSAAEPVERLYKKYHERGTKPSAGEIFSALREVVARYSTVYVVIDALDECRDSDGTRSQLLARLEDLQVGHDVRIMATARFIPDIEAKFRTAIKLEIQASDEDVRRYVAGQTHRLPRCIQRDSALQRIVEEQIVERTGGMFLLARLHIDSLLDKTTAKKVKATLNNLSKGSESLDDAYRDALQRIQSQSDGYYDLARNVLSWITYARRPLTTAELCCALAVEPEDAELDPENMPDFEDMLSVCAGLVVIDQESGVVRLVHYTTQQYFERNKDTWDPDAHLKIASICLTYLSFDLCKRGSCSSDKDFEERLRESTFLDYAAKHWGEHAMPVEKKLCAMACSFLSDDCLVSSATQVLLAPAFKYEHYSQRYPKKGTGAHLAARFGLTLTLETVLLLAGQGMKEEIMKKDSAGQTVLYLAAENGHYLTAQLLLEKGADINAQGGYYGNALQAASHGGHEAVIELLLERGADVNAQGGSYCNALQAASRGGREAGVKLLLERGADVNAQGGWYGNALQAASQGGQEAIIRLLLERGADVNAQGGWYGNALQAASHGGHEAVIKLLLERGADVNAQGGWYGNALQAASQGGQEAIIRLLLERGADVNAQGGPYGNALQAASQGGHEAVIKLLLERRADVNAQGGPDGNALQAAALEGHEAVIKLLLERGADVNAQGGTYGNALKAASHGGHEAVIKLLLERGADVNAQGGTYGNALQAASYYGKQDILDLLICKQKTRLTYDQYGRTLIWWAAAGGHTSTVQRLVSHYDYDPGVADQFGRTPLWVAKKKGHRAVSEFLLRRCTFSDPGRSISLESIVGNSPSIGCHVCTSAVKASDYHFHCRNCFNGNWVACGDCRKCGATCMDNTHVLVKRAMINDTWVEAER